MKEYTIQIVKLALAGLAGGLIMVQDDALALPPETVCSEATSFALAPPKVFWHNDANCREDLREFPGFGFDEPEVISRVAAAGGLPRELFNMNPPRPDRTCNPYRILSNVAADNEYVYWVDNTGLVKLSTDANVGDPAVLVEASITGGSEDQRAEIATKSDEHLFVRTYDGVHSRFYRISKSSGSAELRATISGFTSKLSYDGKFLYYLRSGTLWRLNLQGAVSVKQINTGVTAYFAEGHRSFFFPSGSTEYVWFAKGAKLYRYDNVADDTSAALYTSSNSQGRIYGITSIGGGGVFQPGQTHGVYFFESRSVPVPPNDWLADDQILFRIPRSGGVGQNIHFKHGGITEPVYGGDIRSDGKFLYWTDAGDVLRLPANAAALPKTNMRVTRVEVTQAIQNTQNSVPLIQGKRTFVRVHVKSDGPAVPGVYAHITSTWTGGQGGPLTPINKGGRITVQPDPDQNDIDQSFLFELPLSWTTKPNLRIYAHLNPHRLPMQESYANNQLAVGSFNFLPSPRMELELFAFTHEVDGVEYEPDYVADILPTLSWIRRTYPLSGHVLGLNSSGPGLRPRVSYVFDGGLGERVNRTHPGCGEDDPETDGDERSSCASIYLNSILGAWRAENGAQPYFYYGLMDGAPLFPRGKKGGQGVASGPSGPGGGWDTDSTYADWYTGHELGHTLGRGHPSPGSGTCGHSDSDEDYPYADALIGPPDGSYTGFDAGWQSLPKAVLPSSQWVDMMSYCDFQWISDYTYAGIYDRLQELGFVHQSQRAAREKRDGRPGVGTWLNMWGSIAPHSGRVGVHYMRHVDRIASPPPIDGDEYMLQLLDESLEILGSTPFSAGHTHDEGPVTFGLAIPWISGTTAVQIVSNADGNVLFERRVSQTSPSLAVKGIIGVGDESRPLRGKHVLAWDAEDPDGDQLSYDVLYSKDGGDSFRPLFWNILERGVEIDADEIGGGDVVFKVIATDGVLSTAEVMEPVNIAVKPPVPRITSPADGASIEFGQLLTFVGTADDAQDGSVVPGNLKWEGLGIDGSAGDRVSVPELPVGENTVVLTATNSHGMSVSTSITVFVTDELKNPGPTLSAAPLQIGWSVRTGGRDPVPKTITISNIGSGTITWNAEENAEWLSISASERTAPTVLTISANTHKLTPGRTHRTTLQITSAQDPTNSIAIPVSLAIDYSGYVGPLGPLAPYRDRDRDGLPDWWEAIYETESSVELAGAADSDGDGLSDFLEYSFGSDPTAIDSGTSPGNLEVVSVQGIRDAVLLRYSRRANDPNLHYEIELSSDLINWIPADGFVDEVSALPVTSELERVSVLLQGVSSMAMMRLRIIRER